MNKGIEDGNHFAEHFEKQKKQKNDFNSLLKKNCLYLEMQMQMYMS